MTIADKLKKKWRHYIHKCRRLSINRRRIIKVGTTKYKCVKNVAHVEEILEKFEQHEIMPKPIAYSGAFNEWLWVEYIKGEKTKIDENKTRAIAKFFAILYKTEPKITDTEKTPYPFKMKRDLLFLKQHNIITKIQTETLMEKIQNIQPKKITLGYECLDAHHKNFIKKNNNTFIMIDIEGLKKNFPIGYGIFDAGRYFRNKTPMQKILLDELKKNNADTFSPYIQWIHILYMLNDIKKATIGTTKYKKDVVQNLIQIADDKKNQ